MNCGLKDFQKFTHKIKLYEEVRVWGRDRRNNLGKGTEINLLQLHTQNGEQKGLTLPR